MNNNYFNELDYKDFIKENNGIGKLNIRVYAANEAIPISNVSIKVSKVIEGKKVIFYEGVSDTSGMVPTINLPAPINSNNNTLIPKSISYDILAKYMDESLNYKVDIYDNISVLQNISVVPTLRVEAISYGS